jgi:hypothetical protein
MAGTIANVIVDAAQIYIGTAGSYPTSDPGYTEGGVDFTYDASINEIMVHEETVPIGVAIEGEKIGVSFVMAESTLANFDRSMMGSSLSSDTITLGGGAAKYVSLVLEGTAPGTSKTREILLPYVGAVGSVGVPFRRADKMVVPVEFQAFKRVSTLSAAYIGDFFDATLSSGVLTVTGGYGYRIAGEGDAADQLDSISGGSENDVCCLRIADASNAITVADDDTPAAGTIDLVGTATNWVMDNRFDLLWISKAAGGGWEEDTTTRVNP